MSAYPKIPSPDACAGLHAETWTESFQDLVEIAYLMFVATSRTFPRTRKVNKDNLIEVFIAKI